MQEYAGTEKRKFARADCHFFVSYRQSDVADKTDTSQLKNISAGGALFTASRFFEKGAMLYLKLRLPVSPYPLMLAGKVIESRQLAREYIYDTRIEFSGIDAHSSSLINEVVGFYLKNKHVGS